MFEIVATLAIMSIVMMVVYQGVDSMTASVAGAENRLVNLDEARTLMDATTKDLRTATRLQAGTSAFVIAKDTEVEFYANLGLSSSNGYAPVRVHIYVDSNNQLIEEVKEPDQASIANAPNYTYDSDPTNQPRVRYVGRYVANPAGSPIFTYLDQNGNAITPTPLTGTALLGINSVTIELMIRKTPTGGIGYTTLQSTVRMPNMDFTQVSS
jgi:hypothetical protein